MSIGMAAGGDKQDRSHYDIADYEVLIVNFNFQKGFDITPLVATFEITEDINKSFCSMELVIRDATNLRHELPIIGEEQIIITYRSRGLPQFPKVTRGFRIIKIGEHEHSTEKNLVYKLYCINDHYHVNEGIDINASFAGQNCIKAAANVFKSNFSKASINFRPNDIQKKLFGMEEGSDVIESQNSSSFISTGLTPIEVIKQLMGEAEHKSIEDTSHYVFYQNLTGFHLTTTSELKKQPPKFSYFLKDPNTREGPAEGVSAGKITQEERSAEGTHDNFILNDKNTILNMTQRSAFDQVKNINSGLYGNRVVAIDPLTKKYDERVETYGNRWRSLTPLEKTGGPIITEGENPKGFFERIGSTHTRYIATELLTTSLDTGSPRSFSTDSLPAYSMTPYIYPVDKSDPDKKKDKIEGTIKNEDAQKRQADIVSKDVKIANPRRRHHYLNKAILSSSILNNLVIDIGIPGNSMITVGDIINIYIPKFADQKAKIYDDMFGQKNPRFLVTQVIQSYDFASNSYLTVVTVVKDSFQKPIEKMFQGVSI